MSKLPFEMTNEELKESASRFVEKGEKVVHVASVAHRYFPSSPPKFEKARNILIPCSICQNRVEHAWLFETDTKRVFLVCDRCIRK